MDCRAVCISGADGAYLREIARGVASKLAFAYADEEIVLRAAAEADVDPGLVADAERRRSFMERLFEGAGPAADANALVFPGGVGLLMPHTPHEGEMRDLIRAAIEETAERGSVVIVAHAASHALASRPDVLRVLVTASRETRLSRVAAEGKMSGKDAERTIAQSDAARAEYLKRFYGARSELPTHYDLVVNTDRLSVDQAVALVTLAAGR
jgi:hypothetical protein